LEVLRILGVMMTRRIRSSVDGLTIPPAVLVDPLVDRIITILLLPLLRSSGRLLRTATTDTMDPIMDCRW
jgi:hypothetical protein